MGIYKNILTLAAIIGTTTFANIAIFCQHNERSELSRYGTLKEYEQCGDVCTCYAFELICLSRDATASKFTLLSKSFDYS